MPLMAGTTDLFFRPEEMVYAQSAPGVSTMSVETTQKAESVESGMPLTVVILGRNVLPFSGSTQLF
ncbi:hypothetical protein GCM10027027_08570 [Neomicrococcus lactis]